MNTATAADRSAEVHRPEDCMSDCRGWLSDDSCCHIPLEDRRRPIPGAQTGSGFDLEARRRYGI